MSDEPMYDSHDYEADIYEVNGSDIDERREKIF